MSMRTMTVTLLLLAVGQAEALPIHRIAVSRFDDRSGRAASVQAEAGTSMGGARAGATAIAQEKGDLGGSVSDYLTHSLIQAGRWDVVDRSRLQDVVSEQKLGGADPAAAAATIVGADVIVKGAIMEASPFTRGGGLKGFGYKEFHGRTRVSVQLVEVASARNLWSEIVATEEVRRSGSIPGGDVGDEASLEFVLQEAARKAALELAAKLIRYLGAGSALGAGPASPPPLEADGKFKKEDKQLVLYVFSLGSAAGIRQGDCFKVTGFKKPIKGPNGQKIRPEVDLGEACAREVRDSYCLLQPAFNQLPEGVKEDCRVWRAAPPPPPPPPPPVARPEPLPQRPEERVAVLKPANLRKGPGTDYQPVRTLPAGAVLVKLKQEGAWLQVRTSDGEDGWVSAALTSLAQ